MWSGWPVGKLAPTLRSVTTRAPSFSASATRARQLSVVRWPRPMRRTGAAAPDRSAAARATSSGAGRGGSGARNRDASGNGGRSAGLDSCSAASRFTYVGPHGAVIAICAALQRASYAAGTDPGWLSHFVYPRTSAPWSEAVWIQSIHGRRFAASHGPVAPRLSIATRSHHALTTAT